MCQYSANEGIPTGWHKVHLGSRAVGGAGLVMAEATAISPEGRITPSCTGIWNDEQMLVWKKIAAFIKSQGSLAGIQLAHAGRKGSMDVPWGKRKLIPINDGGWLPLAPSALAYNESYALPEEMIDSMIEKVIEDFSNAAKRALKADFDIIEIHAAHGYLLHEFLSPLTNKRADKWGGTLENRMRLTLDVAKRLRGIWPEDRALFIRISATDWMQGGWDVDLSVELCKQLKSIGVDLVDVSSGGLVAEQQIKTGPGYQVDYAEQIRKEAQIPVGAVGEITTPQQAEEILQSEKADLIFIGRESLRDPYWPRRAATELGVDITPPYQYLRAW